MITPGNVHAVFGRLVPEAGLPSDPRQGFELMFRFRRECPVTGGVGEEADGDMLLFQYGTHDWGDGPYFELNLSRQIIFADPSGGEDPDVWQFALTYQYPPQPALAALGAHAHWISDVESEMPAIFDAPALAVAATCQLSRLTLDWQPT